MVVGKNGKLREKYFTSDQWITIAENVQQDLLSTFEILKKEIQYHGLDKVKPTLVARFGKICFHG